MSNDQLDFLWEAQDATPRLANGALVTLQFNPNVQEPRTVRLTAFTRQGCREIATTEVTINP